MDDVFSFIVSTFNVPVKSILPVSPNTINPVLLLFFTSKSVKLATFDADITVSLSIIILLFLRVTPLIAVPVPDVFSFIVSTNVSSIFKFEQLISFISTPKLNFIG